MHLRGSWLALLCIPLLAAFITNDRQQQQPTKTNNIRSLAEAGSAAAEVSPLLPLQPGSVVALADLHGDLPKAHAALQLLQLVDNQHDWAAQGVTLVQLGDLVDRGPNSLQLLQLFARLQAQSPPANSRVELLLGNHELMLLQQDLRYFSRQELQQMGEEGAAAAAGGGGGGGGGDGAGHGSNSTHAADGNRPATAEGGPASDREVSSGRSMQQQQPRHHQQQQQQQQAGRPPAVEVVEVLQHQGESLGPHCAPSSSSSSDLRPQEYGNEHPAAAADAHLAAHGSEQPSELRRAHRRRLLHISSDAGSIHPPALTLTVPHLPTPRPPLLAGTPQQHPQQHQTTGITITLNTSTSTSNGTASSTVLPSSSSHDWVATQPPIRGTARRMAALAQASSLLPPPPRQLKRQQDAVLAGFAVLGDLLQPGAGRLWQQLVQRQLVAVAGQEGCATVFVHAGLTVRALEYLLAHVPPQQQAVPDQQQQLHKQLAPSRQQQQGQGQPDRRLQEQGVDGPAGSALQQLLPGAPLATWLNAAAQQALSFCTANSCRTTLPSTPSEGAQPPHRQHTRSGPADLPSGLASDRASAHGTIEDAPTAASLDQPATPVTAAPDPLSEQQLAGFWGAMTHGKGPVWNRMLATAGEALVCPEVAQVCRALGVHRLVVGHTPQASGRATVRCKGRLLLLDTGMSMGIYNSTPAGFVCSPGAPAAAADAAEGLHRRLQTLPGRRDKGTETGHGMERGNQGPPAAHHTIVGHVAMGGGSAMLATDLTAAVAGEGGGQVVQQRRSLTQETPPGRHAQQQQQQQMSSKRCRAAVLYGDGLQQELPCGGDAL